MAGRGGNVRVRFDADTAPLERGTRSAERDFDRLERSSRRSLGALKTAAVGAGVALGGALVVGGKEAAEAAIESEKANARLKAQLQALGISYTQHEKQIQRVIDKHSQLSGFDDEDLGDSFTNIVRVVGDVNKALDLNVVAMDLARAKNLDVAKAADIVGKVAGGNTGILSRYGIVIKDGATASEALAEVQSRFAGQAEAYGKTTAGSADRANVAFENLGETLGANVTPVIARVAEGFNTLVRQITLGEGPGGRIRAVFEGLAGSARTAAGGIGDLVTGFRDGEGGARLFAAGLGAVAAGFVAFKAITTVVAAVTALRAAWAGLTAALLAHPVTALAVGVTALVGALGILSIRTRENTVSTRDFNNALRAQRDAMREVEGIELDIAQRRANLRSATVAVEQAERELKRTRREHGRESLEARQAEADLRQARIGQRRAAVDLAHAEDDSKDKRDRLRESTEDLTAEERKLNSRVNAQIADRRREIAGINDSIEAVKQQGVQNDATRKTVEALRKRQRDLRTEINALKSKAVDVSVKFKLSPAPGSSFGTFGDGIGSGVGVGRAVRSSVGRLAQNAVGVGALTVGSSNLDGADFDLGPFAAIGAGLGLQVTSGLRPGSSTSSGNQSYHATGDAIDMSGAPGAMLRFFRTLRAMFGPRLRELIYTPGGVGIKDGRPFRYTGRVAADHHDHVHVAYTGPFGDGLGKFNSTAYGPPWGGIQGTGVTATGVDLRPARKIHGIAVDPSRLKLGQRYWVWPNPFGFRGSFRAFDTGGAIKGNRIDFYDWRGRRTQNAWGRKNVTVYASDPFRGGGSPSGGGTSGANTFRPGSGSAGPSGPNTAAGIGSTSADGGSEGLTGPGGGGFEQRVANAQRRQARARRRNNLGALIKSMVDERRLKQKRLRKLNRTLRGRLRKATRLRLTQEAGQLEEEIGSLTESIKEYRADQRGGATTITEAENLEAGVDPNASTGEDVAADTGGGDTGGAAGPDPAVEEQNRLIAEQNTLLAESNQIQKRLAVLAETQGPQLLAGVVAAVSGSIGGSFGLGGAQAVGVPGQLARY